MRSAGLTAKKLDAALGSPGGASGGLVGPGLAALCFGRNPLLGSAGLGLLVGALLGPQPTSSLAAGGAAAAAAAADASSGRRRRRSSQSGDSDEGLGAHGGAPGSGAEGRAIDHGDVEGASSSGEEGGGGDEEEEYGGGGDSNYFNSKW